MQLKLRGYGHHNISAQHPTTLEFTRSREITPAGDCLVACGIDFDLPVIKNFLSLYQKIKVTIIAGKLSDNLECASNKNFNDAREIVIRMSDVQTSRTVGTHATKGALMLNRELVKQLQNPKQHVVILLEGAAQENVTINKDYHLF